LTLHLHEISDVLWKSIEHYRLPYDQLHKALCSLSADDLSIFILFPAIVFSENCSCYSKVYF